jgi:hypothetical protein
MRIISSGAAAILALLGPRAIGAQCVSKYLPTSASTRALAMGDANTAGRDDDVIFYGPAQLAVARGTSVQAERYFDRLSGGTISSTGRLANGGIGVGAQLVEGRNVDLCPTASIIPPSLGGPFTSAPRMLSRALGVVGGAGTFKRFHLGAAGKYVSAQADAQRTSRFLLDLGVSRDFQLRDFLPLSAALAVQNIGTSAVDTNTLITPLRGALGLGSGFPVGPLDVAAAMQLAVERNGTMSIVQHGRFLAGIGTEVGYTWLDGYSFAIRAGERVSPAGADLRHFTFGAGVVLDRVAVDYAGEDRAGFRIAHRIGVRLR